MRISVTPASLTPILRIGSEDCCTTSSDIAFSPLGAISGRSNLHLEDCLICFFLPSLYGCKRTPYLLVYMNFLICQGILYPFTKARRSIRRQICWKEKIYVLRFDMIST